METMKRILSLVAFVALVAQPARISGQAPSLAGMWDATVTVSGIEIPFRMEFSGVGSAVKGSFFNCDEKITSATGAFQNGSLKLSFAEYRNSLDPTLKDRDLDGPYARGTGGAPYPL